MKKSTRQQGVIGSITVKPYPWSKTPRWRARLCLGDGKERAFYADTVQQARRKAELYKEAYNQPTVDLLTGFKSYEEMPVALRGIYARTLGNAKRRGMEHTLTKEQFLLLFKKANGHCMYSGLPFSLDTYASERRRPFAPSIDRIDAKRGYTLENCRLICTLLNYAFNDWGSEPFLRVAQYVLATRGNADFAVSPTLK
jgi:hypothetical protein